MVGGGKHERDEEKEVVRMCVKGVEADRDAVRPPQVVAAGDGLPLPRPAVARNREGSPRCRRNGCAQLQRLHRRLGPKLK